MNPIIWSARILIACVFLYAGILKLGLNERLAITIAQITFLPSAGARFFAIALPWIEVLTGILLFVPKVARIAAFMAAGCLGVFMIALAWAWSQGLAVDCGCFGEDSKFFTESNIFYALMRDALLLVITLLLAARQTYCNSHSVQKTPANVANP